MGNVKIQKNSKIVMMGDSITDVGRARPIGEGNGEALGRGYVALVDAFLQSRYPAERIRVVNMGNSGDTVRHLKARWKPDVLDLNPDWVSIMIGINDVWRQFDRPLLSECHVLPDEYEKTLATLVAQTQPKVRGLVLMTPYYIEMNRLDPMRARMDEYGAIVKKIARKYGTLFADTQAAFEEVLSVCYPATLAWDRVHPNLAGHMVLAGAFMKAIGCEG